MAKTSQSKPKTTPKPAPKKPPVTGKEQTGIQKRVAGHSLAYLGIGAGTTPPPAGTFATYREMRENPTVAIARIAATVPIRISGWTVNSKDGTPEDRSTFIEEQLEPLWDQLIRNMLFGLDYGFQAFEKVWAYENNRMVYRKLKPLTPDFTQAIINKQTGVFEGLRQARVTIPPQQFFWYTYDQEGTNPYGRSRHENIRKYAYHPWQQMAEKELRYGTKIAGVIPVIEYPEGTGQDEKGTTVDNAKLANNVLQGLGSAKGVAMPNVFAAYAGDMARSGVDLDKLRAWHISFLETKGNHAMGFVQMLRHLEALMLRGWLVPERAVIEGQFGTKAEAATHADLAITMADLVYQDMLRQINWYIINPLLVYNFGIEAENSVYVERPGLDPAITAFLRKMIEQVLTAPANIDLLLEMVDIEVILDNLGVPRADTTTDEPIRRPRGDGDKDDGPNDGAGNGDAAAARFSGPMARLLGGIDSKVNAGA